jgi:hypothetical protein
MAGAKIEDLQRIINEKSPCMQLTAKKKYLVVKFKIITYSK